MGLQILTNEVGRGANQIVTSPTVGANGWFVTGGPRYQRFVGDSGGQVVRYSHADGGLTAGRVVIVRADRLIGDVTVRSSSSTLVASGPITGNAGPWNAAKTERQDYVGEFSLEFNQTYFEVEATSASHFHSIYFCEGQTFDYIKPQVIRGDDWGTVVVDGVPYQTEESISITLDNVSRSQADAYLDLNKILTKPFFLYDSSGTLIPEKLLHVVAPDPGFQTVYSDYRLLSINAKKLRTYQND